MDKRALKTLLSTYWSASGWKPDGERSIDAEEFAYAKSAGVMFEPAAMDHEASVRLLREAIGSIGQRAVADAFIASLSTRRLDIRSALGSYAVFQHMPQHQASEKRGRCGTCGFHLGDGVQDLNLLSFERWKWGGVRHNHLTYAAFDLSRFAMVEPLNPMAQDVEILRKLLSVIRSVDVTTTSASLETKLAKVLKSNKGERDVLISILGFCGVLNTPGHPSFSNGFVPTGERVLPDRRFIDMPYPACWWTGKDGADENEIQRYFGHVL